MRGKVIRANSTNLNIVLAFFGVFKEGRCVMRANNEGFWMVDDKIRIRTVVSRGKGIGGEKGLEQQDPRHGVRERK
jgi:hypothetical protein